MKKRELEIWELAECMALKKAVDAYNAGKPRAERLSQGKIADALGMNQGSVSSYLNGVNALNARVAGIIAGLIKAPVESFSPRLAKEIAEMAEAVRPRAAADSASEEAGRYQADRAQALMGFATPRTRSVLERINQAALSGRLSDADLDLLDQIAARFEGSEGTQPASTQGSHKRLKDKLQKNDPHPKQ